jgi:hypothetical protein
LSCQLEFSGLVVELWPAAMRRNFTLREFERVLAPGTPADRLRADIPPAAAERCRQRISLDEDAVTHSGSVMRVYADLFGQDKVLQSMLSLPTCYKAWGLQVALITLWSSGARGPPCSRMLALPGCLLRGFGSADSQLCRSRGWLA